ncbi:MAG TPA: hypothetical protein VKV79_02110 [Terriglobia bacterium]|nr:hypothetical protein [Terriglobia bacterium]
MAESMEFHDRPLPGALASEGMSVGRRVWEKVKLVVSRSLFWSYERGSWQYDLICALILAFIFLTPASWFHDRPTLGLTNLRNTQGIIEIGRASDGWHYLVDARLASSLAPLQPKNAVQRILEHRLHKPVKIKSIIALRDRNNVILGYTVVLAR